jgi:hypothetical protein
MTPSSPAAFPTQLTIQDKRVNRKMDIFILPILTVLYLFNGMDRGNVGNAATVSFVQDAGLDVNAVNNAVTLFFCTCTYYEIPDLSLVGNPLSASTTPPLFVLFFSFGD